MIDLEAPLDPRSLSAEAQKALNGAAKMMAARGLAPLSDPRDLVSVLYNLSRDADRRVAAAAGKTAAELPENLAAAALARSDLDPRVLHFFSGAVGRDTRLAQLIILNQATADETIAVLAAVATEAEIELIAANEQRLLRHSAIIGAMYANPNGRQATTLRAVELAIHNNVAVDGIANFDELSHALRDSGRTAMEEETKEEGEDQWLSKLQKGPFKDVLEETARNPMLAHRMNIPTQIQLCQFGSKQAILELLRSTKKMIARSAIRSPKIKESDAAKIASNHSLSEAVIKEIARRRDWTKLPTVKLALVKNPKCPLPAAMRFLPFLHEKQIREISRSRGIPSALNAQARKLLMQRGGGRGGRR